MRCTCQQTVLIHANRGGDLQDGISAGIRNHRFRHPTTPAKPRWSLIRCSSVFQRLIRPGPARADIFSPARMGVRTSRPSGSCPGTCHCSGAEGDGVVIARPGGKVQAGRSGRQTSQGRWSAQLFRIPPHKARIAAWAVGRHRRSRQRVSLMAVLWGAESVPEEKPRVAGRGRFLRVPTGGCCA